LKIEHKEAEVTSNVPQAKKKKMTINVEGLPHIMKTLTNLYRDPQMAVIREYATNGVDAHIAAGRTNVPVEITLPTWDDPVYTVKDSGIGMSEWTIENIYSEYGASTKRDSNDQNGAFGLGCKSAFTITNQFTVISVKDGEKTTTLFSRSPMGDYESNVINKVTVDEPNGTTVKIPVREDLSQFNYKAVQFFSFSAPGTFLVDGAEPESAFQGGRQITTDKVDIYLKPKKEGQSFVIMGTVPYELTGAELKTALDRMGVRTSVGFTRMVKYFKVAIGDVDLTPNREGLMFTDKTNKVIDDHLTYILNDLKDVALQEIDKSTTLDEFFESHRLWNEIIPVPREWGGEEVPTSLVLDKSYHEIERPAWGGIHHSDTHGLVLTPKAGYQTYGKKTIVTGHPSESYKKVHSYLGNYMTAKGIASATFIITDDKDLIENKWVQKQDRFSFITAEEVIEIGREQRKKERLEAAKTGNTAKQVKYPVLFLNTEEVKWVPVKEIPAGTPFADYSEVSGSLFNIIRHVYLNQRSYKLSSENASKIKSITSADKIVLLSASRTEKALTERIKSTYNLKDDWKKAVIDAKSLVTDDIVRLHGINNSGWKSFLSTTGLDKVIDKIKDDAVRNVIDPDKAVVAKYEKFIDTKSALNFAKYFVHDSNLRDLDLDEKTAGVDVTADLDKKYPLIDALDKYEIGDHQLDHLVKYLNVVHEESESSATV
jgi:hypothetical protein